jgi:uncharacterized protein
MQEEAFKMNANGVENRKVNWRQVGLFIAMTIVVSWSINLLLALTAGYGSNSVTINSLQLQMLIPAFFAMVLGVFAFKNSPLYFRTNHSATRWFFYAFMLFTLLFVGFTVIALVAPEAMTVIEIVKLLLYVVMAILALVTGLKSGRAARASTGFGGGRFVSWLVVFVGFLVYYGLSAFINVWLGLAAPADNAALMQQIGLVSPILFAVAMIIQSGAVASLLGLVIAFGEEYGWRYYLQNELIKLGKVRGIFLVGLIWGVWHYPVIWMGHNYPGQPVLGTLLFTIFCVLASYIFGYIVLKTGSVWLAAFAHAVNNQVYSSMLILAGTPDNMVLSFGSGIYGLAVMAVIVALILRDPVWKAAPAVETAQEPIGEAALSS